MSKNRDPNGLLSRVKKILQPLWNNLSPKSEPGIIIKVLSYLPEVAKILSKGNSHPDYEAIYYLKSISKNILMDNIESIAELVDTMEQTLLKATYLYLKKKPSGLYILNAHQSKGREFDHIIIPILSQAGEPKYRGQNVPYIFEDENDSSIIIRKWKLRG